MSTWGLRSYGRQRGQGLTSARQLVEALASGWRPDPIATPMLLRPGESCYVQEQIDVLQYIETEAAYTHKSRGGFGLLGLATVAATAAGNRAREQRALQDAAARFRLVDQGTMFLTNERFAIQGRMQWMDFWFGDIRMSSSDGESILLQLGGSPPTQLHVWPPDYHFAMYRWLAYGELAYPPPP